MAFAWADALAGVTWAEGEQYLGQRRGAEYRI